MEFNKENLIEFEMKFFDRNNVEFRNQRYGQALVNTFEFGEKYYECNKLFYENDDSYSRDIVWLQLLKS